MSRLERWLRAHCRNTSHKATTLVRYFLFESAWLSVALHKFLRDDDEGRFHSHPFRWVSVFLGSYGEEVPGGRVRRRWFVNFGGQEPHRVFDTRGRWTLVFMGPRSRRWAYFDATGAIDGQEMN